MFQQEEHYKLARIAVDIPNSLDHEWQLDIRKAVARPPTTVRQELKRIANATRRDAKRVYGARADREGAKQSEFQLQPVWLEADRSGKRYYRLNRDHPLIEDALDPEEVGRGELKELLRLVEETVPVNVITGRYAVSELLQDSPYQRSERELVALLNRTACRLRAQGMSDKDVRTCLLRMEPFNHHPAVVEAMAPIQTLDCKEINFD
jgi:hypothetical protein